MRDHIPFRDCASSVGIKVTIPISNDQMKNAYCQGNTALARQNAQNMFNEIYGATGTAPHPAAGMLKIFNAGTLASARTWRWWPTPAQRLNERPSYWKVAAHYQRTGVASRGA